MIKSKTSLLALVTLATAALAPVSQAATAGDLVLAFYNTAGTSTLLLDVGSPASMRDSFGSNTHLATTGVINSTFGASWFNLTTLNVSAVSTWNVDQFNYTDLLNLDPADTIYVSRARATAGTVGTKNSVAVTVNTASGLLTAQGNIANTIAPTTNPDGSINYFAGASKVGDTTVTAAGTGGAILAANNPTSGSLTSYGAIDGQVQQPFSVGTLFSSFGPINNVEIALDIYRLQYYNFANNGTNDQYGYGQQSAAYNTDFSDNSDPYSGQFIGTIVLSQVTGDSTQTNIDFVTAAVPEPSTYAMLALVAVMFGFVVVRRKLSV